jgi:DNA-binding CsgD family transcriptional regulator
MSIIFLLKAIMLTAGEKQIVYLILRGFSNPKIAEICQCSLSTTKTKIRIIYAKCNVISRIGLIREYYENPDFFKKTAERPKYLYTPYLVEKSPDNVEKNIEISS